MTGNGIKILTNLETQEVSCVKRGANERTFAITKSEVDGMKHMELLTAILKDADYPEEARLEEMVKKQALGEKEQNALKGALRILHAFKDNERMAALANVLAEAVGYPKPRAIDAAGYPQPAMVEDACKPGDAVQKALALVPAQVRELVEKANKEAAERIEKAEQRAAEVEKVLKAERDQRMLKEFVTKAASTYANIPGKAEDLGAVLKHINDLDTKACEQIESVLKSAQALLSQSALLTEQGRAATTQDNSNSASALDAIMKCG